MAIPTTSSSCGAARMASLVRQNLPKWCNAEFDAILDKAKQLPDQAERAKLYERAQVIYKEEAPDLTLAHSVVFEVMRAEVDGYKQTPLGGHHFKGVTVK